MRVRSVLLGSAFTCAIAMFATNAMALSISPASALLISTSCNNGVIAVADWDNDNPDSPDCEAPASQYSDDGFDFTPAAGTTFQYKQDVGGGDSGPLAGSYSTTFNADNSGGTIEYVTGQFVACPTCYLVVKDGFADPSQYLFSLGNWNGTDDIILSGFWPNGGAISHVEIYSVATVPDGGSVALLLGMALMGLAGFRRMIN